MTEGCRVCGQSVRGGGRGLCQKHYRRWKAKFDTLLANDEKAAESFEFDCIRDGWIKERSQGGRPREDDDPFDEYAEQALKTIEDVKAAAKDAASDYRKVAEKKSNFNPSTKKRRGKSQ